MPQFLILARDYKDKDALNRRLTVRPAHLLRMKEEKEKGVFIIGGAKLTEKGDMYGSMLVVDLPDVQSVSKWVATDPYMTGDVWENVEIVPFRIAEV